MVSLRRSTLAALGLRASSVRLQMDLVVRPAMSVMMQMKNPPGEPPPPPGRLYWICQAAGWGSFVLYTLGFYLVFGIVRWEVVLSIIVIDGVLCPALTHALRSLMYRRGWLKLPPRSRLLRALAAALVLAIGVSALVLVVALLIPGNEGFDRVGGDQKCHDEDQRRHSDCEHERGSECSQQA